MGKVKKYPEMPYGNRKEKKAWLNKHCSSFVKDVRDFGIAVARTNWGVGPEYSNEILDFYRRRVGSPNMVIRKHRKPKSKKNNNTGATA